MLMARWEESLENIFWFPNCHRVSTARGMQIPSNSWHLEKIIRMNQSSLRSLTARAAAPIIQLYSPKMTGVRGDGLVISSAAGLPMSHPK